MKRRRCSKTLFAVSYRISSILARGATECFAVEDLEMWKIQICDCRLHHLLKVKLAVTNTHAAMVIYYKFSNPETQKFTSHFFISKTEALVCVYSVSTFVNCNHSEEKVLMFSPSKIYLGNKQKVVWILLGCACYNQFTGKDQKCLVFLTNDSESQHFKQTKDMTTVLWGSLWFGGRSGFIFIGLLILITSFILNIKNVLRRKWRLGAFWRYCGENEMVSMKEWNELVRMHNSTKWSMASKHPTSPMSSKALTCGCNVWSPMKAGEICLLWERAGKME